MNITSNYQIRPFYLNSRVNNQQTTQTNPSFGNKVIAAAATALIPTATVLAMFNIKDPQKAGVQEMQTKYGQLIYIPSNADGEKAKLVVIRKNGTKEDIFANVSAEALNSPVMEHVHPVNASTINPKVGIKLTQNQSSPVVARKVLLEGTLGNSLFKNNMFNVSAEYSNKDDSMFISTPWAPGKQLITGKCFMVTYGTVKEDWGALKEYIDRFADPDTGEAPDVAVLAADNSFMPADIAGKQYEIVLENGERIPCFYDDMEAGVDYSISKKAGVELKMAVPDKDVTSSEGELLKADVLYMVDSNGHFYNGQPIKRIKSGEVTWNADMSDPVQANIRNLIDESLKLEAEAKTAKKAGNKELADKLSADAKSLTQMAEEAMTKWVKSAQNPEGVNFFAE